MLLGPHSNIKTHDTSEYIQIMSFTFTTSNLNSHLYCSNAYISGVQKKINNNATNLDYKQLCDPWKSLLQDLENEVRCRGEDNGT